MRSPSTARSDQHFGQHFSGNRYCTVTVFPVGSHSFRNVARSWHLAVNSFIVRRHVTTN